jgi:hypothetical protein
MLALALALVVALIVRPRATPPAELLDARARGGGHTLLTP